MYCQTIEDAHNFTDYHINQYDHKTYWGDILEKQIDHQGPVVITTPKTCAYCSVTFDSRNQLFRHLGYCNVDIRPRKKNKKRNYRQMKITSYYSNTDYDADTENEDDNYDADIDVLSLTRMMKSLTYRKNNKRMKLICRRKNKRLDCDVILNLKKLKLE